MGKKLLAGITAAVALAAGTPGVASAGTGWTTQPVPVPSNSRSASLDAVSCWSTGGCIAVGRFFYRRHGFRGHALAEEWNGSAWSIQHLRRPGTTWNSTLTGISCVSARSCTAVGAVSNSPGAGFPSTATAERWNGSTWAVQPVKSPGGAATALSAVACTTAARCTAVGNVFSTRSGQRPLAERWDGHAWAIQPTPAPSGANPSRLSAVSCGAADSCVAVGTMSNPDSTLGPPMAESWDGSSWTLLTMPDPPGSFGTLLFGLSCASVTSCVATGENFTSLVNSPLSTEALVESWDGSSWTIQTAPISGGAAGSALNGVSCLSASSCTAVGHYARGALAEYWNGSTWHQQQTTHPAGHNQFAGVSCLFARSCTAVGLIRRPGIDQRAVKPLAEQQ